MSQENRIQLEKIGQARLKAIVITDTNRNTALAEKLDIRNQFSKLGIRL